MSRDEMLALAAKFERGSIVTCAFTDHEKLIAADALRLSASLLDGSGEKIVQEEAHATKQSPSSTGAARTETAIREALEFYADPWAWKKIHDPQDIIGIPDFYSELSFGGAAKEAIAVIEAASKRPILSVSGNINREQQRNTMGVTAGETALNSPAVAETDANAPDDTSLVSGATLTPINQPPESGERDVT